MHKALPASGGDVSFEQIAAALKLDRSAVSRRAQDDGWPFRERAVRGGRKKVFALAALPKDVRDALFDHHSTILLARHDAAPVVVPAHQRPLPTAGQLANWQRCTLEARAAILAEIDRIGVMGSWRKGAEALVASAKAGTLRADLAALVPVANAKAGKAGSRTLSLRTLYRWLDAREIATIAGAAALAPKEPARPVLVHPWAAALLVLYRQPQKPSLAWCLEELPKRYPDVPVPSYDQARRFVKSLSPIERNRGRMGPLALKALKSYV